jgi:hypothetical protein
MIRHLVAPVLLVVTLFEVVEARQNPPVVTPTVPVAANSDEATVTVQLTNGDALTPQDLAPGLLATALKPGQLIVPVFRKVDLAGAPTKWSATLVVGNLIPFGEITVPLLVRGQPTHNLRFHKAGLIARAPVDGGLEIEQGGSLFVVLENPTAFAYSQVRARWRFNGTEVCQAVADASAADGKFAGDNTKCHDPAQWVTFGIARHAPVTLRVEPPAAWFHDPQTGFPRAARRSGVLTLQYVSEGTAGPIYEQSLPLDVQFHPGDRAVLWNLVRIGVLLAVGAVLALVLRVVIPNYRRKEALKDQLNESRDAIGDISIERSLRVLLKVELLALDQLRQRSWVFGPSFADYAHRFEQGIEVVHRKIDFTRRLDTARERKLALEVQEVAPTRLQAIDRYLNAACEVLLREQLTDQEWVFVQQRLEAADRLLTEPTKEERDAFQAFLVQRWKAVRDFFYFDGQKKAELAKVVGDALPGAEMLPDGQDADGSLWIQRVGPVRGDVQISMLEVLREYVFVASLARPDTRNRLIELCKAPSAQGLEEARLIVREVSERVDVNDILRALRRGEAAIDITPQSVRRNEKSQITLRFRDPALDGAGARLRLRCEWIIGPADATNGDSAPLPLTLLPPGDPEHAPIRDRGHASGAESSNGRTRRRWWWQAASPYQTIEYGWKIFQCFPDSDVDWAVTARLYHNGERVEIPVLARTTHHRAAAPGVKNPGAEGSIPKNPATETATPNTVEPTAQKNNEPSLPSYPYRTIVQPRRREQDWGNFVERIVPETVQLLAALLVPLVTLAITQADEGTSGRWWELIGVGFGSEMIRSVLTGKSD